MPGYEAQYPLVGQNLCPHRKQLVSLIWQAVDSCSNLETSTPSLLHHMVETIADAYFDFLQAWEKNLPDHLGEALNQAGATPTFLLALNKTLRHFCMSHLEQTVLIAGLEATADFFLFLVQTYIQTNQGLLAISMFSRQERDRLMTLLTPRELTMLQYLSQGMTHKQIAQAMGVTVRTVGNYLRQARQKLGTRRKTDTLALALAIKILVL